MTTPEFQEILEDYLASSRELLEKAEEALLEMEQEDAPPSEESIRDLKRVFHTLKGNSAMMGYDAVARAAHLMEDALVAAGSRETGVDDEATTLLLSMIGRISEAFRSGEVPETPPPAWAELFIELAQVGRAAAATPAQASGVAVPGAAADDLRSHYLGGKTHSLRVTHASLERLLELSGEVRVLLGGLSDQVRRLAARSDAATAVSETTELLMRTFGLLEREVFATRLVPVGTVLARFRRLVRDLSLSLGKEVDLLIQGGETMLDKSVVDELGEPLLHLVRNALDHGLETPEQRISRGKPRRGTLTVAARQASSLVEIAVLDDGGGIDLGRVRRKAAQRGIHVEGLDETMLSALIFLPEFSTHEGVSTISGRGVGLDVVKSSVERLGGSVTVRSLEGRGTEFRLSFPLTLAVSHALLVSVDGETFALPVSFVEETVRLGEGAVHEVASHGLVEVRGLLVPAVDAGELLGTDGSKKKERAYAAILAGGGRRKALLVDRPLGALSIVVKPLDDFLGKPLGISGATLLGDGRVVMILDAPRLLEAHLDELRALSRKEA